MIWRGTALDAYSLTIVTSRCPRTFPYSARVS